MGMIEYSLNILFTFNYLQFNEKTKVMPDQLFMEERRRAILQSLRERKRVSVKDLSVMLNVSAVTIRQDLRALADQNLLERTHGGAVLPQSEANTPELSFDTRLRESEGIKQALARTAAAQVKSGYSIAMDASTTVFAMVPYLKQLDRLIVVTNSLVIAQNFLDSPHIQVMMPGGRLRRDSISLVGKPDNLPDVNLNCGFFGAHGITPDTGVTESSMDEVRMKQAMMAKCLGTYIIVDERKWGKIAPYTLATADHITEIITPATAPETDIAAFRQAGVRITLVD